MNLPDFYQQATADLQRSGPSNDVLTAIIQRYVTQTQAVGGVAQQSDPEEIAALLAQLLKTVSKENCTYNVYPFFMTVHPSGVGNTNGAYQQILPQNLDRKTLTFFYNNTGSQQIQSAPANTFVLFETGPTRFTDLDDSTCLNYTARAMPLFTANGFSNPGSGFLSGLPPTNPVSIIAQVSGAAPNPQFSAGIIIEGV